MHFDLRDLQLFVCIAESESLTHGAKRANISLAAASNRLKGFEEQLGTRLFYRETRGVSLTTAGTRLLRQARGILQKVDAIKADFSAPDDDSAGHLRISANTTAVTEILPSVLADFLAQRPGVSIDLQEALNRDIVKAVIDGSADLGIVSDEVKGSGLEVIPFATDKLLLAVPEGSKLVSQRAISFFDTLGESHIGLHEGSSLFTFLEAVTREIGGIYKPRVKVFGFEPACRMVESGVGVAVVPECCAFRYIQTMNMKLVELTDTWATRRRCILLKDRESLPRCGQALIESVIERYGD
ncbi:LysR family transcriptional regulator [Aestuariicella hydrocarbonica]|uniref:LysR family transcriptional regulator n=1 Tax=Pseudomaricurvus hydrocarbonicus TaxID=1470433 RepID=A0A9E5MQ04_9GAMM|nr:LysR family transcriptional regulator [Aestuariicella hydrocarbonica]NHO68316.1 LysR family transcriptional regulator [Aestuariicella hydrocarbonica]